MLDDPEGKIQYSTDRYIRILDRFLERHCREDEMDEHARALYRYIPYCMKNRGYEPDDLFYTQNVLLHEALEETIVCIRGNGFHCYSVRLIRRDTHAWSIVQVVQTGDWVD